jgi:hypothetical protein
VVPVGPAVAVAEEDEKVVDEKVFVGIRSLL